MGELKDMIQRASSGEFGQIGMYAEDIKAGYYVDVSNEDAANAETGWQPIETAPKDGSDILAWRSGDFFIVRWYKMLDAWCDEKEVMRPTHWMPLPKPPERVST